MCKRPFLAIGITSVFVAWIGSHLSFEPMRVVALCLAMITAVCALCHRSLKSKQPAILCATATVVLLMLVLKTGVMIRQHNTYADKEVSFTARVTEVQKDGERLMVRAQSGGVRKGTKLYVWAGDIGTSVREGDLVTGRCEIVAAFDVTRPSDGRTAKAGGIYLYAWPADSTVLLWHDGQVSMGIGHRMIAEMRQYIRDCVEDNTVFAAPLCQAMMVGERDGLSADIKEAFRACGIYHVLAVSGLHLSVLIGALFSLLGICRCSRRLRALITMAAVLLFMALCGFSPSVTRAGVMTLTTLASMLFRRRADGLNSLGLAATVLLLVDPFSIYDVGWQLSFAATLGLLGMGPAWQREITDRAACLPRPMAMVAKPLCGIVGATTCATLTTLPFTAYWYGELSLLAPIGNVLLIPAAGWMLVMSFVGTALSTVVPHLAAVVFRAVEWMAQEICSVAEGLASISNGVVWGGDPTKVLWLICLPIFLALAYRWFGMRGVCRMVAGMSVVAVLIFCGARYWWRPSFEVRVANGEQPTFAVRTTDGIGVVMAGGDASVAQVRGLLLEQGAKRADWILWIDSMASSDVIGAETLLTERLIVLCDPSHYTSLPTYDQIVRLSDGEIVSLTASLSVSAKDGVYRLETDEVALLTADEYAICLLESTPFMQADVAVLPASLPLYAENITVSQAVICGEEYDVYRAWNRLASHTETTFHSPQIEESIRIIRR